MPKIELRLIGDDDKVLAAKNIPLKDEDLTHGKIYHNQYWGIETNSAIEFELLRRGRDLMRDALLILKGIGRNETYGEVLRKNPGANGDFG